MTEKESSLRNVAFSDKNSTMDNVQKHNICTDVPSSQTFKSCLFLDTLEFKRFTKLHVTILLVQVEQVVLAVTFETRFEYQQAHRLT
jgi:hypothetical protein